MAQLADPFMTRSIHDAIAWHRAIRAMRHAFRDIYGETRRFSALELAPKRKTTPHPGDFRRARTQLALDRAERLRWEFGRLLLAQDGCCYLCDKPFSNADPPTEDHVWPKARRGRDVRNRLLACAECNNEKGDRLPTADELATLRRIWHRVDDLLAEALTHVA